MKAKAKVVQLLRFWGHDFEDIAYVPHANSGIYVWMASSTGVGKRNGAVPNALFRIMRLIQISGVGKRNGAVPNVLFRCMRLTQIHGVGKRNGAVPE